MAGIYLHIPFCKQACHYCNFHFSTSMRYKSEMVRAIAQELAWQHHYLAGQTVDSIYLGGGTPSLLDADEVKQLLDVIGAHYQVTHQPEITLEANPDDLTPHKVNALRQTPINRFSIGIQSFQDADLQYMNRSHHAAEALASIQRVQDAGWSNLTIDLIYGTPTMSDAQWAENLNQAFALGVPHLSSYALTVEPRTALDHFVRTGQSAAVDEDQAARQFEYLQAAAAAAGMVHYEISNFGQPGYFARHNTSYWQQVPYLGVGPSAHSFDGATRQWNVAHNAQYLKAIAAGQVPYERETLSAADRYNEYIMTGLRTIWGVKVSHIATFGERIAAHFAREVQPWVERQQIRLDGAAYVLAPEAKFLADGIASELFYDAAA